MIRINQLKISIDHTEADLKNEVIKKLGVKPNCIININILRRSVDARKHEDLKYIYSLDVEVLEEQKVLNYKHNKKSPDIMESTTVEYKYSITGTKKSLHRPVIIGSGPAGLFCGYFLALNGYQPIIIERGEKVEDRIKTIQNFWDNGVLDSESNVQFGEGGAGTFSDGKLNTLVKDTYGRIRKVLEIFVEYGAPSDILYLNKPHIGTDYLRMVIKNLRNRIIELGGEVRYKTKLTDIILTEQNKVTKIKVEKNCKEEIIDCDILILAIGHSARDTFYMLNSKGINMEAKSFAVGLRIEHEQELINKAQYGIYSDRLSAADYKLTHQCNNGRNVYTFCMCPGGFIVNASSEENKLTINGMSNYKRDEKNANSAVIVSVNPKDFESETNDSSVLSGISFQRKFETLAYQTAQGKVPVQLFGDLLKNKKSDTIGRIIPNIKGKYQLSDLRECLPDYIIESVIEGIQAFDKKIQGFADEEVILDGIEMRTSSPIRILRNEEFVSNIEGLYPCGEGAGYAGGITSAAVDGMKVFEAIIKKYRP